MTSYIYFIQAKGDGPIKIGSTGADPRKRMVKIQSDCPWPVKLIGTIEGTVSQEKQIHLVLSRFKTQGEWFDPHPIVLAAIKEAMKCGHKVPFVKEPKRAKYAHPLCKYRSENKLTLKAIARDVGVNHASLSRVESGNAIPSWGLACRISKSTGIHVKELRPDLYSVLFDEAVAQ